MVLSKEELQEKTLSLVLESPIRFSGADGVEHMFVLDVERIQTYFVEYLPKWVNNIRYFLISEIRFGIREKTGLYLSEESGELYVF